jgi:hypothetical protein
MRPSGAPPFGLAPVAAALALAGCGSSGSGPVFGGGDLGADGALLDASSDGGSAPSDSGLIHVTVDGASRLAVDIVLVGCQAGCANVRAVVSGGNPPYTLRWSDGSQAPARMICGGADAGSYQVTASDTASSGGEFPHPQETATASLSSAALGCGGDAGAQSSTVYWARWSGGDAGASGNAQATISAPSGDIAVTYAGEMTALQTSTATLLSSNYWTPASTYTSATVANGPPDPGILELTGGTDAACTVTFSRAITNPLMAVFSLGDFSLNTTASYELAEPFVILSTGPGIYGVAGSFTESGQTLVGHEGNGVIQLTGTFTSIQFKNPTSEYFSGITVGVRE